MSGAKQGDTVKIHYMGKLEDGTVFDSSQERHPLQFTIGRGQVIAGFEQAIIGMKVGESKTTKIPVELGYGPRRDDLIVTVERSQFPAVPNPKVGQRLEITQTNDQVVLVTVTQVTDSTLSLDSNHPLAGKVLTFDLQLIGVL